MEIAKTPHMGTEKSDLRGVFVYQFKLKSIEYLLSYRFIREFVGIKPQANQLNH